ncbi:hypothetical protein FA95DRAFT_1038684 [Auriscalpium vulgare]|uniref:Uncharacterized protein n=1 Tax=Auriscalpium vulgare TaxID=40419 RepID=A0ACB8RY59_9AGAM|nr:hypothetical protein FA95DRAFT_1038684 [Auriscalpium vulgare]
MPSVMGRQSGEIPLPRLPKAQLEAVEDDIMDGDLTELEHTSSSSSESESECESEDDFAEESDGSEFDGDGKRPTKRRKTNTSKASKSSKKSNAAAPSKLESKPKRPSRKVQGQRQNMLAGMPLDVLFEMFTYLPPVDLLSLARTSKDLRKLLMSRKSASVWKASRGQAPGLLAPEPPEDLSEPAWVDLIYGSAVCSVCGAKNIHRVDFALRRRMCTRCMKSNLVFAVQFKAKCPGVNPSVMDLLPFTHTGGWAHGHSSNSKFYWRPDVIAMHEKLAEFKGDAKALKAFRKERVATVGAILEDVADFETWAHEAANARSRDQQSRKERRLADIVSRLSAAGYEKADIDYVNIPLIPGVDGDKDLTEQAWKKLKPKLETVLVAGRPVRLAKERRNTIRERTDVASIRYTNLWRTCLPAMWFYLPPLSWAPKLPCFKDLIDREDDVAADAWADAVEQMPMDVAEWMEGKRNEHLAMLPGGGTTNSASMEPILLSSPTVTVKRQDRMRGYAGQLELATSVFSEGVDQKPVIGRDTCHAWKMGRPLSFSVTGAASAAAVIGALRLNPITTIDTQLDALDGRLICMNCSRNNQNNIDSLFVFSWRLCIEHDMHMAKSVESGHQQPRWHALQYEDIKRVKMRESNILNAPCSNDTGYLCNHCPAHAFEYRTNYIPPVYSHLQTKETVLQHLLSHHQITAPIEEVDFLYLTRAGMMRPLVKPVVYREPLQSRAPGAQASTSASSEQFLCIHCGPGRKFKIEGVKAHIKAKHKPVGDILLYVDYKHCN